MLASIALIAIIIGSLFFLWHRYGISRSDQQLLSYIQQSKDLNWGVAVAFKPMDVILKLKPEHQDKIQLVKDKIINQSFLSRDEKWWNEHVSSFAFGKIGDHLFNIYALKSNPETFKTEILKDKLIQKNADGTYNLIIQKNCKLMGPMNLTIQGNILAITPKDVKFILPESSFSLRLMTASVKPKSLFDQKSDLNMMTALLVNSGALDAFERLNVDAELNLKGLLELSANLSFNDEKKAKQGIEFIEKKVSKEFKPKLNQMISFQKNAILFKMTSMDLESLKDKDFIQDNDHDSQDKKVTKEMIEKIAYDDELEKPVNYTDLPDLKQIFAECNNSGEGFQSQDKKVNTSISEWFRSFSDQAVGSFLQLKTTLCFNKGYVPLFEHKDFLEVKLKSPQPSYAACGIKLNTDGTQAWFKTSPQSYEKKFDEYLQFQNFGISDQEIINIKEIVGDIKLLVPKKIKKHVVSFIPPYEFNIPIKKGTLVIKSSKGWSGINLIISPDGELPPILSIRGLNAKKVYLNSTKNFDDMFSGMLQSFLEMRPKKELNLEFKGKLAEIEITYVDEYSTELQPFKFNWSIPVLPKMSEDINPSEFILTADTFEKIYSNPMYHQEMLDSIKFDKDPLHQNNLKTSGPFIFRMYEPHAFFKNDIRIDSHKDFFEIMKNESPYQLKIKKIRLSNNKEKSIDPIPEVIEEDIFGQKVIPWGHYTILTTQSNSGSDKTVGAFFDDHLDFFKEIEREDVYPTYLQGELFLKRSLSYKISSPMPIDLYKTTQFEENKIIIERAGSDTIELFIQGNVENKEFKFLKILEEKNVSPLIIDKHEKFTDGAVYTLSSASKIKGLYVVLLSSEIKEYIFPFEFGSLPKPKGKTTPKKVKKKTKAKAKKK